MVGCSAVGMPMRRSRVLSLALATVVLAGACASGRHATSTSSTLAGTVTPAPSSTSTSVAAVAAKASPSAGCANPAPAATSGSVTVDGEVRTYLLALPTDLTRPAPVILDLHGLGESNAEQFAYSGLSRQGPAAGMIVVTPASDDAINSWTLPSIGPKDSDFMGALLDQLESTRCVDRNR